MERLRRFTSTVREYWKRLLIGAITAWLLVNAFLIALFVVLEYNHYRYDDYSMARFAQSLLMFSLPAGALIAYSMRGERARA